MIDATGLAKSLAGNAFGATLELRNLQNYAALAGRNFKGAVAGFAHDPPRLAEASVFCANFRFPYQQLSATDETERAGVRMRHGPHKIEDSPRRPSPVYPSVLRLSAPEVTSLRDIHFSLWRGAGDDLRMHRGYQLDAQRHQLAV